MDWRFALSTAREPSHQPGQYTIAIQCSAIQAYLELGSVYRDHWTVRRKICKSELLSLKSLQLSNLPMTVMFAVSAKAKKVGLTVTYQNSF